MEGNLDSLYKKLGVDIQRVEADLEFAMRDPVDSGQVKPTQKPRKAAGK